MIWYLGDSEKGRLGHSATLLNLDEDEGEGDCVISAFEFWHLDILNWSSKIKTDPAQYTTVRNALNSDFDLMIMCGPFD